MFMIPPPTARTRFSDWPLAVKSILGFWFFYALTAVARAFLGSDPWATLENKLVIVGVGIVLTGLIYLAIARFGHGKTIRRKAIIATTGSTIASIILSVGLIFTEDMFRQSKEEFRYHAREGFVVVAKG
jgi:hypothetical protein